MLSATIVGRCSQNHAVRRQIGRDLMTAQPQCALGIGFEALNEQTIEAAPVRLDPQRELTGERPLDAGDDLPRALALQPPAVGGGQLHVVVALKALVRRRLGLLERSRPTRSTSRRGPTGAPAAATAASLRERVPVEPHARLERHPRSERQPMLRPPADLRPCQAGRRSARSCTPPFHLRCSGRDRAGRSSCLSSRPSAIGSASRWTSTPASSR